MADQVPTSPGRTGPLRPRRPEDFDEMYTGTPPWDIGRPQLAFLTLADAGALRGKVLDAGCGTGEHALMAAERGFDAQASTWPARRSPPPKRKPGSEA